MGRTEILGHDEKQMQRAGKRDGRRWRWSLKPWFIVTKNPSPAAGEVAPKIQQVGEAAEEMIAGLLKGWHQADGHEQKKAKNAVESLRGYVSKSDQSTMVTVSARARSVYGDAKIDRKTAWQVARAEAKAISERYGELAKAYADANQAARREERVDITVPELGLPIEFEQSSFVNLSTVLGLSATEAEQLGLGSGATDS